MLLLLSDTESFSSLFAFALFKNESIEIIKLLWDFKTFLIGSAPSSVSVLHSDQSDQWDNFGSKNQTPEIRQDLFQGFNWPSLDRSLVQFHQRKYLENQSVLLGIFSGIPDLAYPWPDWNVSNLCSGRQGLWNQIIIFGSPSGPALEGSPRWVLASCSCSRSKLKVFPFGHKLEDDSTSSKRSMHKLSAPIKNLDLKSKRKIQMIFYVRILFLQAISEKISK